MTTTLMTDRCYLCVPDALVLSSGDLTTVFTGIAAINVSHARITVPWSAVVTTPGSYSFGLLDTVVNTALSAGVTPLLCIAGSPPHWLPAPTATDYADLVTAVATRYQPGGPGVTIAGKGVVEYQIWNEPNAIENWTSGVAPGEYVAHLKAAHTAIKKVQPLATVIFAGLQACATEYSYYTTPQERLARDPNQITATLNLSPFSFLAQAYTAGAKGFFDVMAYHPLSLGTRQNPRPPAPNGAAFGESDQLRSMMVNQGDGALPMYWTAVGYDTSVFSPAEQATYLDVVKWAAAVRPYVTALGVYTYRD